MKIFPKNMALLLVGVIGLGAFIIRASRGALAEKTAGRIITTSNLTVPRHSHTATLLPNGQILIAGGADQPEVYDSASKSFLPTAGDKLDDFYFSTTTLLPTGQVLMVGGYGRDPVAGALNHAWLYQP